ncbi:hypothetical protein HMPREF9057_01686 [Actinomyces sp. oral taxon 171 str. F0337]|nr:hypothetical protein HMPREF9057_01686 [Actinomyces sp. oral taxon 171 str. F0337]
MSVQPGEYGANTRHRHGWVTTIGSCLPRPTPTPTTTAPISPAPGRTQPTPATMP